MSRTFTKLFSSITESTVWCEPAHTRLVWITMLAMADRNGRVWASVPGLANRARVPLQDCEIALNTFLSPDKYSRTPDHDGRRIEPIDGGWKLLNYEKYRAIRDEESTRESKRRYINERRAGERNAGGDSGDPDAERDEESGATGERLLNTPAANEQPPLLETQDEPVPSRFDEWWEAYPKKVGKKPARAKWTSRKLDKIADLLIADVKHRADNDDGWQRGFIPDPMTYLNQDRWEDELRVAPQARVMAPGSSAPSKTVEALDVLRRTSYGSATEVVVGRAGQGALEAPVSEARGISGGRRDPRDVGELV